jgi:hypothetical protein
MVRNLRIVRLSVFNKLLKAQDLRNAVFVRILPEEPFLSGRTLLLRLVSYNARWLRCKQRVQECDSCHALCVEHERLSYCDSHSLTLRT